MKGRLTVGVALSLLLTAGGASAVQPWLADRRYGEGIGIRAGRFELHPGIAAEFGYDSNFFQRAEIENPADAWRFRVTPSLTLSTLTERRRGADGALAPPPMLNLSANLYGSYSEVFGSNEVSDQRNFDIGVGAKADIAPQRPFGADIYADYTRSGEPSNSADIDQAFDRGQARGGLGVTWRPGGGLFDWRLGYEATYSYFEDQPFDKLENLQHSVLTRGRWRIMPRSGFLYDAKYTFIRYLQNDSPQPSGDMVQARLGFSGLVTNRIAFLILAGWNSTFYEQHSTTTAENYDGYVGQAELKYFILAGGDGQESAGTGLSSVAVGFTRDASNSYLASFYTRDRAYLGLNAFFAGVFAANLQGGFSRYSFPSINAQNAGFEQKHVDVNLFAEYRLSDIVGLNFTGIYDQSLDPGPTDQGVVVQEATATAPATFDDLTYKRFQAYIGLRLFW